jgi:aspartate kinase
MDLGEMQKEIAVMKIGGAILKTSANLSLVKNIVQNYCPKPTVLVFSAFSNLSRQLREIAFLARNSGLTAAMDKFTNAKQNLLQFVDSSLGSTNLAAQSKSELNSLFEEFEKILFGISVTKELTPRTLDRVLSFGEYFSTTILASYLKSQEIDAEFCDAKQIIKTDSNYGMAKPIYEQTRSEVVSKLLPLLEKSNLVFTQGFIGSTTEDIITTMGFESSSLTALLIANILDAKEVIFWTDVEGIRTADPKIVDSTSLIPYLSFDYATIASLNGLKLIHPAMIDYFKMKPQTSYIYRSAFKPENGETYIVQTTTTQPKMILVSEPCYLFENAQPENTNTLAKTKFELKSADSNLFAIEFVERFDTNQKLINIVTALNFEPKILAEITEKKFKEIIFFLCFAENKIAKFFVENDKVKEFVNELHRYI